MITLRKIILTFFVFHCGFIARVCASDDNLVDLGKITVTKSRPYYQTASFSEDSAGLKDSPYGSFTETLGLNSLDLQSRAPEAGMQTDFSLRGSTYQGVLMLVDGQRINDPQTGHHNSDLPFTNEDLARIDVIPGVGSSTFGSDAIGGAVNFTIKKPSENKTVVELEGGEHMTRSGLFSISRHEERYGYRVSVQDKKSDGFRPDTDFGLLTTNASAVVEVPDGEFFSDVGYQDKEFGAYDFYTPDSGYESKEWTRTYLSTSSLSVEKEGFYIKPNFLWKRHYDKFMLDKTFVRSKSVNVHHTDIYTPNIYFQKDTDYFGKVGLGLEYGKEQIISSNIGKHDRFHESIYLDDNAPLGEDVSIGLSGRYDHYEGTIGPVATGLANLTYRLTEKDSVFGGLSKSVRMPSFTELYYSDPTTIGNADLSEEKALTYEMGHKHKMDTMSFRQTFFLRREENFIDWVKLAKSDPKWQSRNINSADVFGIENCAEFNVNQTLSLNSNYTYLNRWADDSGVIYKYGTNYIKHLLNNTLDFHFPFGTQSIGISYKKKPGRRAWTLVSLGLAYQLNKQAEIFVKVSNLFNVEYQEIAGIPQPGRWAEAGVRIEW